MIIQDETGKYLEIKREEYSSSIAYYMTIGYIILNKYQFQNLAK
jgi:hypothetical protein